MSQQKMWSAQHDKCKMSSKLKEEHGPGATQANTGQRNQHYKMASHKTECFVWQVKQSPHWLVQTRASCSAMLLVGAESRKRPGLQALHCVSLLLVPVAFIHSPREQVFCTPVHATASDTSLDLFAGASTLNLPLLQVKHSVSAVELPTFAVHSPAEHFRNSLHTNGSASTVLLVEPDARNRPALQVRHWVSLVVVPMFTVHSPCLQLACTSHSSVWTLVADADAL